MNSQRINRASFYVVFAASVTALFCVLSGYFAPPQTDEGDAAHIFQLSIVALAPTLLVFLVTADWRKGLQSARALAIPAAAMVLAFVALYHLEH
jgi:heme O synthase-like polyprenyltransferase